VRFFRTDSANNSGLPDSLVNDFYLLWNLRMKLPCGGGNPIHSTTSVQREELQKCYNSLPHSDCTRRYRGSLLAIFTKYFTISSE
jgi:hypothetical protein